MEGDTFVLRIDAVRAAIGQLQEQAIHPFFPAYLHLRQRAGQEGSTTGITPRWKDLGVYLEVAGAPADKPYYRPFWEGIGSSAAEWLNSNLAGSFAGSSLRAGKPPLLVVDYDAGSRTFSLRQQHWELAREHLLDDERVSLGALFAFLLRDFAFLVDGSEPTAQDVVDIFCAEFGYAGPKDNEVEYLYDLTVLEGGVEGWFELVEVSQPEVTQEVSDG